jgi:hypothetical protein
MPSINAQVKSTRVGQHIRRVGDDDPSRLARIEIDVVAADGNVRDDLQVRASVDELGVDTIRQQTDERLLALNTLDEFLARHRRPASEEINLIGCLESRENGRWNPTSQ